MAKMNPEVKARWIAALRSGEYKQAREKLRDRSGAFCCLGVLCKLYADDDGKQFDKRRLSDAEGTLTPFFGDAELPHAVIAMWSGADWEREVRIQGKWDTLYNHNDDGRTFAEIADAIEAQL